ncbi:uracil-DNA glycosylase family protein [Membranihabitans maritimus]|uniref:uracil-DNA glycosylase family protein n=1 Tax=Membranihabitans maritimus TaxID=2904244 RepID=UPI001F3AD7D8
MKRLLDTISECTECAQHFNHKPNPVLTANPKSKIIIIGQAPGSIVHRTGIPWDDKSGENLRSWMGIEKKDFYNEEKIALLPMGFCYPGKGKSGDLPPRKECAPLWHSQILTQMKEVRLILLIGKYAQDYYLGQHKKRTLTETVKNYAQYLPEYFVLPHPSPRNNIWQAKNPWFKENVLPELKLKINQNLNPAESF